MHLTDSIRHQILGTMERQVTAMLKAKPEIDAAEKLETLLRAADIEAHAFGNLTHNSIAVGVQSYADPADIQTALAEASIDFSTVDAAIAGNYALRSMLVSIDNRSISLIIQHDRERAAA